MKRASLFILMVMLPLIANATTYEVTTPGNNVGIGSTNPGQALDVQGTIRDSLGLSIGSTNPTSYIAIKQTSTAFTQPSIPSQYTDSQYNHFIIQPSSQPDSVNPLYLHGIDVQSEYNSSFNNNGEVFGVRGSSVQDGDGINNQGAGIVGEAEYDGTATTHGGQNNSIYAGLFNVIMSGSGEVDHMMGIKISKPAITGTTHDINGLYISDQTAIGGGSSLQNEAVHIAGGTFNNAIGFSGTTENSGSNSWIYSPSQGILTLAANTGLNIGIGSNNPSSALIIDSNSNIGIGTSNPVGSLIIMNGNVGIGTNIPGAFVQIGSGAVGTRVQIDGVGNINSNSITTNGQVLANGNLSAGGGSYSLLASGSFTSHDIKDVSSTGNVGIGSTNPGQALDVQGTVRALDFSTGNTSIGTSGTGATSCLCKTFSGGICTVIGTCT